MTITECPHSVVIDSSAILCILLGEPEAPSMAKAIAESPKRLLAAVTVLESAMVVETKKGPAGGVDLES
jgi:ribonuclease VapC